MLPPANQFFESLPKKRCTQCGSEIEEQSECYMHMCDECSGIEVYPLTYAPDRPLLRKLI